MPVVSDCLGAELDPSVPESIRDEEEAVGEEQKDDGKLGFCEIQWQQESPFIDGRKFTKKNFKRLDDPTVTKLGLSITKIDEEKDDDRVQIIHLTSPMKVRSPLGYRSTYDVNVPSRVAPMNMSVSNIRTISHPLPPPPETSHESMRKSSLMSLKSLSMSLRLLKNRGRSNSVENVESTALETIEETSPKSIFHTSLKLDLFERNLKKFVSKSNEADFQTYSEYAQTQQNAKARPKTYFKNQKVYARRSSMSDINEPNQNPKNLQHHSAISTSSSNVKHEAKKHEKEHKKSVDKTAEMLKEVRKRNLETSKRICAPRRISTAY